MHSDTTASQGWGMLAVLYAIPYAITGLVFSVKNTARVKIQADELMKLHELKEKGVITESEFNKKKNDFLS
jgi:hypothetical protein